MMFDGGSPQTFYHMKRFGVKMANPGHFDITSPSILLKAHSISHN